MVVDMKKLYALMLIPIILLGLFASVIPAAAQGESEDEKAKALAEKMIMIANRTINYAETVVSRLEDMGVEVPSEALEALDNATTYLEIAKEALNTGDYTDAVKLALKAMRSSKYTVRVCFKAGLEVLHVNRSAIMRAIVGNETVRKAYGLLMQIKWLRIIIERFLQMNLTVLGENAAAIQEKLVELNETLDEAEEKLREGLVNETAIILSDVRKEVFRLIAEYHKVIAKIHMEKRLRICIHSLERFLKTMRKRLEKLRVGLKELENEGVNVTVYVKKIRELNETITEVLVKVEAGNVTKETVIHIFIEISRLYPKIRRIKIEKEMIPKLEEKISKVSEIINEVLKIREEKLRSLIEKIEEKLEEEKTPGRKMMLKHFKEMLIKLLEKLKEHRQHMLEKFEELEGMLQSLISEVDVTLGEIEGEIGA